jgi:large subunit ribosomal protein L35Ae
MPGGHPHHFGQARFQVRKQSKNFGLPKVGEAPKRKGFLRLFVKGVFTGFKRGLRNQDEHTAILRLEDVNCKEDALFYMGKRVAYVYKVNKKNKEGSKFRVTWGKISRVHGSSGAVRAKFAKNLPPAAMGQRVRVMLYPSKI